jgi:uncharacterized membrane protein YeaQ/YmgE (transglycosylase-associated protein family)
MNIVLWMLAGGILGWGGHSLLHFNEERGALVSVAIGALGGIFGGKVLAQMFSTAVATPGAFNASALIFAAAAATAFLAIGNMVYKRWGV